jgi:arsenate reductase
MAQIWARAAACHFGLSTVEAYSGGTEATRFNPRAVAAIRRAGFAIDGPRGGDNPVYRVRYSEGAEPMECCSKIYDASPNPTEGFAAVMTCSAADAGCPVVRGAVERISLPYGDPGDFDGTLGERDAYDERCRQIAREVLYAFSLVRR